MSTIEIEKRLTALERRLNHLARVNTSAASQDINAWIDQIHGTFQNDTPTVKPRASAAIGVNPASSIFPQ